MPSTEKMHYFAREKFILRTLGVSLQGGESFLYKVYSFLVLGIFVSYPIAASGDLFKHEFDVVAELYVYVVGTAMGVLTILLVFVNRIQLGKLIDKLEQEPFIANVERGGDVEAKLIKRWFSLVKIQSLVFVVGVTLSGGFQIFYTLMQRIKNNDPHDWIFSFGPLTILDVTHSPNYEISWLYQNISVSCIGCNLCMTTLILAGTLANISTQFQILQNNIRRIPLICYNRMIKDKSSTYEEHLGDPLDVSVIHWKYLRVCLKEAVAYHLNIFEIIKEFEEIFSILMMLIYLGTLSIMCFEVYRATLFPLDDPRMGRLLVEYATIAFQVFIICFSGEQVAQESELVAQVAYEVNFVGSDTRFQKGLTMIIGRSQNPTRIKAGKLIETSLITFAWILRASYSAFIVLRNVNSGDL